LGGILLEGQETGIRIENIPPHAEVTVIPIPYPGHRYSREVWPPR
jgi:hypothetical protein